MTTAAATQSHPKGLWVLFITEMWERFSYYGMRALLVLYLVANSDEINAGFVWEEAEAYKLYGFYTSAVYLTPLLGGYLADKFLGTHRSMLIGGWIIAAGHITLAFTELFGFEAGRAVGMDNGAGAYLCFMAGLALIVIGTGFFKPCVSVMVGQLYEDDDPRRDGGFVYFYMGINVGAALSGLVAGTLGEKVGWHWGFGSAAVGMLAGMAVYQWLRPKYLKGIGLPPNQELKPESEMTPEELEEKRAHEHEQTRALTSVDFQRMIVICILAFAGNIFFWSAFEQAGTSLNVFAAKSTDLTLWGLVDGGFPATWYQSVNPVVIVLFAPLFTMLWAYLDRTGKNPTTPMKFSWGLYILGLSFLAMVFGSMEAQDGGKAGAHWLLICYVGVTWGELCLSPIGLSMVTKLAPKRYTALFMGLWFLSFSLSNLFGGFLAAFSTGFKEGTDTFIIPGLPGFFLLLVILPIGMGVVLMFARKQLSKMMHGIH